MSLLNMPKIYTKTGDKGESSLYNGERRRKTDPIFEALGDIDELNASIGMIYDSPNLTSQYEEQLNFIQSRLLDLGSYIATPRSNSSDSKLTRTDFVDDHTLKLEEWIDDMDENLPKLTKFILPIGVCHMPRAICRRAERSILEVADDKTVLTFINRLSDYFFNLSRILSTKEIVYQKQRK